MRTNARSLGTFDLQDYGATIADIGPGLQSALLAAQANGGGLIRFPRLPSTTNSFWQSNGQARINLAVDGTGQRGVPIEVDGMQTPIKIARAAPDSGFAALSIVNGASQVYVHDMAWIGNAAIGDDVPSVLDLRNRTDLAQRLLFYGLQTSVDYGILEMFSTYGDVGWCDFIGCRNAGPLGGTIGGVIAVSGNIYSIHDCWLSDLGDYNGISSTKSSGRAWIYVGDIARSCVIDRCFLDEGTQYHIDVNTSIHSGLVVVSNNDVNMAASFQAVSAFLQVRGAGLNALSFDENTYLSIRSGISQFASIANTDHIRLRNQVFLPNTTDGLNYAFFFHVGSGNGAILLDHIQGMLVMDMSLARPNVLVETINDINYQHPVSISSLSLYYDPLCGVTLGTGATFQGSGGTFAAVTAGHQLKLNVSFFGAVTITFSGSENTIAAFISTINTASTALGMGNIASNVGGQLLLSLPPLYNVSSGSVLNTTNADVLTSLGLTATAFALPRDTGHSDNSGHGATAANNLTGTVAYQISDPNFNGQPSFQFGSADNLSSGTFGAAFAQPFTIALVCRQRVTSGTVYALDGGSVDQCSISATATHDRLVFNAGTAQTISVVDTKQPMILLWEVNAGASTVWVSSDTALATFANGANTLTLVTLGNKFGAAVGGFDVAACGVFSGKLTLQQRQATNAYLSNRFGIPLLVPPGGLLSPAPIFRANHAGSPYTLMANQLNVWVDVSGGPVTLNVPGGMGDNVPLSVNNTAGDPSGANAITVNRGGTDTIQDPNNLTATPGNSVVLNVKGAAVSWIHGATESQWRIG